ncbi:peroxiredoxin-like family protein [Sphingobium sp. AN558]|uniref:peroxiredoxin-like family protein n=1 Tax=Sphingobium sp. AN558 TaxID=3133442 RepID=UPI0030BA7E8E
MTRVLTDSLKARYDALQAQREQEWSPAQLAGNARQRQTLVDRLDPAAVAQPGDRLAPLTLDTVEGGALTLDALTANGTAVLIFFRFAGCPACNIALPYYAETLWPELRERGIPLVAVSPQPPTLLGEIKLRHSLPFEVATDRDNALARALGISFEPDDRPSPPPAGWIGEAIGTNSWELPQPAVLAIGPGRTVQWLQVSPDWLDRPEAEEILARLDS